MFVTFSLMEWNNGEKLLVSHDSGFLSYTQNTVIQFDSDLLTRLLVCVALHIFKTLAFFNKVGKR